MKIRARKILYIHLHIDILIRTLVNIFPFLSPVNYVLDVFNAILLFLLIHHLRRIRLSREIKRIIVFILVLIIYDLFTFILKKHDAIMFIWGIRNQYRFLIFMLACAVFLEKKDCNNILNIFYNYFVLNLIIITIEFALGYKRDLLGGTFGLDHNCNSIVNIYLCVMCSFAIVGYLKKTVSNRQVIIILLGSLYWASLAELKIFYLNIVVIFFVSLFIIRGKEMRKTTILIGGTIAGLLSIALLLFIFPEQAVAFNRGGFINYARYANVGIHGYGRLSVIPLTKRIMFNNDTILTLFGIGTGNSELIDLMGLHIESSFYSMFKAYAYNAYFYAVIFIERGWFGIAWYSLLFAYVIVYANKKRIRNDSGCINEICMLVAICLILSAIYDAGLKTSSGGYIAFCMLGIVFAYNKKQRLERRQIHDSPSN